MPAATGSTTLPVSFCRSERRHDGRSFTSASGHHALDNVPHRNQLTPDPRPGQRTHLTLSFPRFPGGFLGSGAMLLGHARGDAPAVAADRWGRSHGPHICGGYCGPGCRRPDRPVRVAVARLAARRGPHQAPACFHAGAGRPAAVNTGAHDRAHVEIRLHLYWMSGRVSLATPPLARMDGNHG